MSEEQRRKLIEKLHRCQENVDIEDAHYIADQVLVNALTLLGESELVDEWNKVEKWYA